MKNFINNFNWEFYFPNALKLLMVMKLTVVLILASVLSILAGESYSQTKMLTLKMVDAKVEDVLAAIEKQSEFYFFIYSEKVIDADKKVSVDIEDQRIETVLNTLFAGTNVAYTIRDRLVVLSTPEIIGYTNQTVLQQPQRTVSGKVTDFSGSPLPGVTVVVKGTTQGTVTNADGDYTLTNIPEDATLVFSFVGMRTQEMIVRSQTNINITMEEETIGLEEVVAIGYGTQKKLNLTGAISTVSSKELADRPVTSLAQALQGIVPNLSITTTDGGRPGSDFNWNIRGRGTIGTAGASSSPLFIIDGAPGDPNVINPEDIESVSVLKDAAASAIYGSRAPYGVVIITTKKGERNKMKVKFNSSLSWRSMTSLLNPVGSLEYVNYRNEGAINRGEPVPFDQDYIDAIKYHIENPDSPNKTIDPANPSEYLYNVATDINWWRETYKNSALTKNYNLAASGGTEFVSYYLSLGAYNQDGQYRYGDENFKRYTGLLNLNANATNWLELGYKLQLSRRNYDAPNSKALSWMQASAVRAAPTVDLFEPNGRYGYYGSGIQQATEGGRQINIRDGFDNQLSYVVKPLNNLMLKGNLTFNTYNNIFLENTKICYTYDALGNIKGTQEDAAVSDILQRYAINKYYSTNIYADYTKQIGKHNIHFLLGYQQEFSDSKNLESYRNNLISEDILSINVATGSNLQATDSKNEWATMGYFGRFTYNYQEKYLFEFNGRYDGTSRFPLDYRWGFFPSTSVGYIISKEKFFEPLTNIANFMKLRASYGRLGNANVNLYYTPTLAMNISDFIGADGTFLYYMSIPGFGNYNLTWEKPTTLNLAVDLGFLKNRLQTSFDWYTRKTVDMVGPSEPLPSVLGTDTPQENNTELIGKGWEFTLSYKGSVGTDFQYQAGLNISRHRAVVEKYYNPTNLITTYYKGMELGEIWGYETVGFINDEETLTSMADQSFIFSRWGLGDIQYKDLNGDGKIDYGQNTLDDHGDLKIIGSRTPDFEFNITFSANYKGLDMQTFWTGRGPTDWWPSGGQGDWTSLGQSAFFGGDLTIHSPVYIEHMDRWTPENLDAYYPRNLTGSNEKNKNQRVQTKYLQNISYLRLKNLQLGYTFPSRLSGSFFQQARIYISGENLLTFTSLRIFDPEVPGIIYPLQKVISLGISTTF